MSDESEKAIPLNGCDRMRARVPGPFSRGGVTGGKREWTGPQQAAGLISLAFLVLIGVDAGHGAWWRAAQDFLAFLAILLALPSRG